jgi:hypothetical protein
VTGFVTGLFSTNFPDNSGTPQVQPKKIHLTQKLQRKIIKRNYQEFFPLIVY